VIEQLIARVFYARNFAHFEHWRAKGDGSFAKHSALGSFYDDIIDALDPLVEAYQGAFEIIGNIPAPDTSQSNILKLLEADAEWIEENHESVCQGNRALANLLDTVTGTYLSAIYKLRNLR
jgi:hypothetical protein